MTTNPLAKNARYARAYGYRRSRLCPPGLVMLVAFSQTVEDVSENARANLEYIDMRFGAPLYRRRHHRGRDQGAQRAPVVEPPEPRHRPRAVDGAEERRRGGRGRGHDLAAQGAGLQARRRTRSSTRARVEPDRHRLRDLAAAPTTRAATTRPWRTCPAPTATSRTSRPGTLIEHSRAAPATVTDEHIHLTAVLDNTSQVHCNQFMIDQNPKQYVGGQLIIFGGIPFTALPGTVLSGRGLTTRWATPALRRPVATRPRSSQGTRSSPPR